MTFISIKCDFCKTELRDSGGLLFSPPSKRGEVKKFHLCAVCYTEIVKITRLGLEEIEDVISVGPAWLNYTRKIKRKKGK